ncbi:MAG: NUDIX hydrolase [Candidatus Gracilibacteria bacterium]
MRWKLLKTKHLLQNRLFDITESTYRMHSGRVATGQFIIKQPDSAIIAVFTKKMELVMVRQYRHTLDKIEFELPAGYAEKNDATILHSAKREFLEETGYKAKTMKRLAAYSTSPGVLNHTMQFFIGFDAERVSKQNLDKDEEIQVLLIPWKKALKMVDQKKIHGLPSVTGILLAKEYMEKTKK